MKAHLVKIRRNKNNVMKTLCNVMKSQNISSRYSWQKSRANQTNYDINFLDVKIQFDLQSFIANYTMNDYNDINPGSRRGPQGPDPEPPPDESNLKRAISCESVCSDTSVVLNDLEEAPIVGHVCVGVQYDRWGGRGADSEGDLAVSVLEARDLITPDGQPAQDTFARFEHSIKRIRSNTQSSGI